MVVEGSAGGAEALLAASLLIAQIRALLNPSRSRFRATLWGTRL
jgi:hypothetical protein